MRTILRSWASGRPAEQPGRALLALLEASGDAMLALDGAGGIAAANGAARAMLGCDPVGRPVGRYLPAWRRAGDGDPGIGAGLGQVAGRVHELTAVRESGHGFPVEAHLSLGAGYAPGADGLSLLHLRDVSERVRRVEELERLALHDALTGLPNRLLLDDRLRQGLLQAQRRGEPLAVLLLDLNGFKQVNDTLGHQVGDRLLQHLAPRLGEPLRKSDTLARLGGDEFAILLPPPTDLEEAGSVAERLVLALAEPFTIDGARLEVGASIGVALYPDHGTEAAELIRRADAAMYVAKRSGLGFAVCDHQDAGAVLRRRGLRRDLQEAIETDGLRLLFQPKVQARSLELAGVEALVAWQHPEHGLLRAPDFLPLAEQTGLVLPLTIAVLNGCLRQQQRWRQAGRVLPVAVNLTPRWLLDDRFPQLLQLALRSWEGRPGELTLEATESAITAEPARAQAVLDAVARLGCRVSIDDFGTGYSCLAHLQRLPVAELKVDRGFVADMASNRNAAIVVRGIVRLAHGLGLRVVAEGVETPETAAWLGTLGCDELQGFLFGRPMPVDEFDRWLARAPGPAPAGAA